MAISFILIEIRYFIIFFSPRFLNNCHLIVEDRLLPFSVKVDLTLLIKEFNKIYRFNEEQAHTNKSSLRYFVFMNKIDPNKTFPMK